MSSFLFFRDIKTGKKFKKVMKYLVILLRATSTAQVLKLKMKLSFERDFLEIILIAVHPVPSPFLDPVVKIYKCSRQILLILLSSFWKEWMFVSGSGLRSNITSGCSMIQDGASNMIESWIFISGIFYSSMMIDSIQSEKGFIAFFSFG